MKEKPILLKRFEACLENSRIYFSHELFECQSWFLSSGHFKVLLDDCANVKFFFIHILPIFAHPSVSLPILELASLVTVSGCSTEAAFPESEAVTSSTVAGVDRDESEGQVNCHFIFP